MATMQKISYAEILIAVGFLFSVFIGGQGTQAADENGPTDRASSHKNPAAEKIFIDLSDEAIDETGHFMNAPKRREEVKKPASADQKKYDDLLNALRNLYRDRKYLVSGYADSDNGQQQYSSKDNKTKKVVPATVSSTLPDKRKTPGYLYDHPRKSSPSISSSARSYYNRHKLNVQKRRSHRVSPAWQ